MAGILGINHSTVVKRLSQLRMVIKADVWVKYEWMEENFIEQISAINSLCKLMHLYGER